MGILELIVVLAGGSVVAVLAFGAIRFHLDFADELQRHGTRSAKLTPASPKKVGTQVRSTRAHPSNRSFLVKSA